MQKSSKTSRHLFDLGISSALIAGCSFTFKDAILHLPFSFLRITVSTDASRSSTFTLALRRQNKRLELKQLPMAAESNREGFGPAFCPTGSVSSVISSGMPGESNSTLNWYSFILLNLVMKMFCSADSLFTHRLVVGQVNESDGLKGEMVCSR
jgi:hypothetical protein